jgi:hypothetical protein
MTVCDGTAVAANQRRRADTDSDSDEASRVSTLTGERTEAKTDEAGEDAGAVATEMRRAALSDERVRECERKKKRKVFASMCDSNGEQQLRCGAKGERYVRRRGAAQRKLERSIEGGLAFQRVLWKEIGL